KHRFEDALSATRAAVEEGIVPGGGVSLVNVQKALNKLGKDDDEKVGVAIVRRALEEPLRTIANNAGQEGSVVVEKVRTLKAGQGFNAQTEQFEDLMKAGVVDPLKVTRSALENAASIAGMVLPTEALVADRPEKEKAPAAGGHGYPTDYDM